MADKNVRTPGESSQDATTQEDSTAGNAGRRGCGRSQPVRPEADGLATSGGAGGLNTPRLVPVEQDGKQRTCNSGPTRVKWNKL